jgi:hypothetical protein
MLLDEICDLLLPAAADATVADVRIGLGYTAVQLEEECCGLAYTFREEVAEGCGVVKSAGTLVGRQASELSAWAKSTDALAASVGLATLNALIRVPPGAVEADLANMLVCGPEDEIGMVGNFRPRAAHSGTPPGGRLRDDAGVGGGRSPSAMPDRDPVRDCLDQSHPR